jgi:DNA polymerase III, delta subunit
MIHSNLIITQTQLDTDKFNSILGQYFVECFWIPKSSDSSQKLAKKWLDINGLYEVQPDLEKLESLKMDRRIIIFGNIKESTDSVKEQFRQFVASDVYQNYSEPTLLILGDLSQYSTALQEGMLKLIEEPPSNLFVILTARSRSEVLPTILSRCMTQNVSSKFAIDNLDKVLFERVSKYMPKPKEAVELLLKKEFLVIEKLSDVERNELDFWLWLVETNLSFLHSSNPEPAIARLIQNVLTSRELNNANCLKKLVVQNLSL